jgi:hypothetical protein
MPYETARGIIKRYNKTGARAPLPKYSLPIYNKEELLLFLYRFYQDPTKSSATLAELQSAIWEARNTLLPKTDTPPSLSTIHRLLVFGHLVWKVVS